MRYLLQITFENMYLNHRKQINPKCNIIIKIISFIKSLYFLNIFIKRFKTNETSFHTDTHIFLICLIFTYKLLC